MKRIALTLLSSAVFTFAQADIIINEIMQSNIDAVMDDLNEFPDSWVELYNSGSSSVNLKDYKLGITDNADEAWPLPSYSLAPNNFKLVYCDKTADKYHTDYRLESGKGCNVYLFKNGEIVDQIVNLKKQPAPNIAYGRKTDADDAWGYQVKPTPGESNYGQLASKILGDPVFSENGRVVIGNQQLTLTISCPDDAPDGTVIRYTTNGSEPTASSTIFPADGLTISSTKVIRAKLFCNDYLSPRSVTQSYLFFPRNFTIPIVSVVTDSKYFTDSKIGIYVDGNYSSSKKNYEYDWRRPINFELFEAAGEESQLNQLCETRVAGAASRGQSLKSLAFYANKRFGEKRFKYEFFPDQRPGINDFKSFMMRNAGNDFDYLYMRDAIIQATMASHVDLDYQAWRPAIFYLNGTYKGMLNFRERSNDDNIFTNYDGLEDIDMIENWWELKTGTWDNWREFETFYNEHGHTWDEFAQYMDVEEFMNLMIMNLFYCNLDFPGNNIVMWRPTAEGGRWRFVAKDTDFGLGLYGRSSNYNTIEWIYNPNYDSGNAWANQYEHTRLFRRLMEDETFNREFIDHCAIYMGDFMNFDGTWTVWEPMYNQISYEYPNHRKLFNQWWPNYNDELNSAKNWLKNRPANFYRHLANYYKLGSPTELKINQNVPDVQMADVAITFNGVQLSENRFNGKFFENREISLHGVAANGRTVTGWTVKTVSSNGSVETTEVEGDAYTFNMPKCKSLEIDAIYGDEQGIDDIFTDQSVKPLYFYDVNGVRHDHMVKGQNIIIMSNGETQKVSF